MKIPLTIGIGCDKCHCQVDGFNNRSNKGSEGGGKYFPLKLKGNLIDEPIPQSSFIFPLFSHNKLPCGRLLIYQISLFPK